MQWGALALYCTPALLAALLWGTGAPALDGIGVPIAFVLGALGCILADRAEVYIEVRKQTFAVSVNDIPLSVGLIVLTPLALLIARLLAKCVMLVVHRASPGKMLFNLGIEAFEIAVAVAVVDAVSTNGSIDNPVTWLAVVLGVVAADLAGSSLIALAIGVSERRVSRRRVLSLLVPSACFGVLGTAVGLLGVLVISVNPWGASLLLVVFGVGTYGHRAYRRFLSQHERLGQVYAFSQRVEESRPEPEAIGELLEFIRETLNARAVTLLLAANEDTTEETPKPGEEAPLTSVTVEADQEPRWSTTCSEEALRVAVLTDGRSRLVSTRNREIDQLWADAMAARGASEVILAPLRTRDRVWGIVEAADRQVRFRQFGSDEVRLLDNLARHLAAAVENQRLVERLRLQAFTDQLTGLANRVQFTVEVAQALELAEPEDVIGVAVFGVDAVKAVNDTLGHDAGDQLVVAVADRLRTLSTEGLRIARVGGNVFALLLHSTDLGELQAQLRSWYDQLHPPGQIGDVSIELMLHGGLAVSPVHGSDPAVLLQRANVALEAARNTDQPVIRYAAAMERGSLRRLQLATDLRAALNAGHLQVHYQPKVALPGNTVDGVEALMRWEHPEFGFVPPDEFIPLAERTGLIGPLTTYVLEDALRQCRRWLDRNLQIGVAVNLSVLSLLDPELVPTVSGLLTKVGVPTEMLTLEITEGMVMAEPDRALPVLQRLHDLGIKLAVDDFGTGYSSLAYLSQLPVDDVKIDKTFILGMGTGDGDLAIVRTIIELCHSLGFRVVAEGVEDELTRDLLRGMGCDVMQGYLISRPLPVDRFDGWHTSWLASLAQQSHPVRRMQIPGL
jgi:diguanylate cyclase (GGDEF)-like protein